MNYSIEELIGILQNTYNRENDDNINISEEDRTNLAMVITALQNGESVPEMYKDSMAKIFRENPIFDDERTRENFLEELYKANKEQGYDKDGLKNDLISEIEDVQGILNTNPQEEDYSPQEQIESQQLDQIKTRIKNEKIEKKDQTFLHNIFDKYIPEMDIPAEEREQKAEKCHNLVNSTDIIMINVTPPMNGEENEQTEEREIDKIAAKLKENEAFQAKYLSENLDEIKKEFIETTQKELAEFEGKELSSEEENKKRVLEETIKELDKEGLTTDKVNQLLKARGYNNENELYLRVIDRQIEELKQQLANDPQTHSPEELDDEEELNPEEKFEMKVNDDNREDILRALNEVLDQRAQTGTEEEKQTIEEYKNNLNSPEYKNEDIERLINEADLSQEVLESRISQVDKEIEEITSQQNNNEQEQSQEDVYKEFDNLQTRERGLNDLLINIEQDKKRIREAVFNENNSFENTEEYLKAKLNEEQLQKEAEILNKELKEIEKQKEREINGKGNYKGITEPEDISEKMRQNRMKKIGELDDKAFVVKNRLTEIEYKLKENKNKLESLENEHTQELEKKYEERIKLQVEQEKMFKKELEEIEEKLDVLREKIANTNSNSNNNLNDNLEELKNKKEQLEKELEKLKKQKAKKEDEDKDEGKDNNKSNNKEDIQRKLDELEDYRERIASIPELRRVKDAYNTIKKDAINILGKSESFINATDEERKDAISTGVETHEKFKDLELYKGDKEKLIRELKEDIAKALGRTKGPQGPGEPHPEPPKETKEKLYLKALSGAAGFGLGFGTAMITSGIPATIAVGVGLMAVKIYSKKIAPNVNAKIEKIQSAENYAEEHPIKNTILNGVKKVNNFLSSGYGQWFINGFGLGYAAGKLYKGWKSHENGGKSGPEETDKPEITEHPTKTEIPSDIPTDSPKVDTDIKIGDRFKLDKDLGGATDANGNNFGSLSDRHTDVVVDKIKGDYVHVSDAVKVDGKKELVGWIRKDELIETLEQETTKRIGRGR